MLAHLLSSPRLMAWVGFIASATHLGTPANALHAIDGLGVRRFLTKWCRPWRFVLRRNGMDVFLPRKAESVCDEWAAGDFDCMCDCHAVPYIVRVFHRHGFLRGIRGLHRQFMRDGFVVGPALTTTVLQAARVRAGKWPYALSYSCGCACCGHGAARMPYEFLGTVGNNVTRASALVPNYGWLIAAHGAHNMRSGISAAWSALGNVAHAWSGVFRNRLCRGHHRGFVGAFPLLMHICR